MTKRKLSRKTITDRKEAANSTLISNDFFPKGFDIDISKIFPLLVVATMSSGKSTLINALLGQEILPSKNEACTAKIYSILDDDRSTRFRLYITDVNGQTVIKEDNLAGELDKANNDNTVSDVLICGQVKGVLNTDKALLIVDTPGPNNSRDNRHQEITENILDKVNGGLLLYVMNVTQMEINDDKALLKYLNEYIKMHNKSSILFVLNKVDQLDEEKGETIESLVINTKKYLIANGFENPNIIPVSALAANIFKKVLNEEKLTRSEYRDFTEFYDLYMPKDFNMKAYAITEEYPNQFDEVSLKGKTFKVGALIQAIENTGIRLLEDNIQKAQIISSEQFRNSIQINKSKAKITKFFIEYNPHLVECVFKKNGKSLGPNSRIGLKSVRLHIKYKFSVSCKK